MKVDMIARGYGGKSYVEFTRCSGLYIFSQGLCHSTTCATRRVDKRTMNPNPIISRMSGYTCKSPSIMTQSRVDVIIPKGKEQLTKVDVATTGSHVLRWYSTNTQQIPAF